MPAIIATKSLGKIIERKEGARAILKDVNFNMQAGEFLCIMGPSGSGKTTLLQLLAGLEEPSVGEVLYEGRSFAGMSDLERTLHRRNAIAQVFQFFNLMPNLSLRENVGLPLAIAGNDPDKERGQIDALIDRLGLSARSEALPHELSGGEMQRTSIARALAGRQALMLCDEPTGNLSQQSGAEIMQTLRDLCDHDGKSVLLVTHNPRDAAFADRILFLVDGEMSTTLTVTQPDGDVSLVHAALQKLAI